MFCKNCGAALTDDDILCKSCGQPVNMPCDLPLAGQMDNTIPPSAFPLEPDLNKLSKNKRMVLTIIPSFAAVLIIGAIIGTIFLLKGIDWKDSNFTEGTATKVSDAAIEDGIVTFDGVQIDFGGNDAPGDASSIISAADLGGQAAPEGLASDLYRVNIDPSYTQPVTISIPFTGDPVEEEGVLPLLGIGTAYTFEDGSEKILYHYFEADIKDHIACATFIPSEVFAESFVMGNGSGTFSAGISGKEKYAGIFKCSSTFSDGGHFIVYYPWKTFGNYLGETQRLAFLNDLEAVYNQFLAQGYKYDKRAKWPIAVNIQSEDVEAAYDAPENDGAGGSICIDRQFFDSGYQAQILRPFLVHEFFHFVQFNYVSYAQSSVWIDEATASYYESAAAGGAPPDILNDFRDMSFDGAYPVENTARGGYARIPLIDFLARRLGSPDFIRQAYILAGSGTDWAAALNKAVGDPGGWAGDYYSALVKGEVGTFSPNVLIGGLSPNRHETMGTSLALITPSLEQIDIAADQGEVPVFGTSTLHISAYGAQAILLTIDQKNIDLLQDNMDPAVRVSGNADIRVFSVKDKDVIELRATGDTVSLTGFKAAVKDGRGFLVLVTGLHASGKMDYTVRVEMAFPTLDELVGSYPDGTVTIDTVFVSDAFRAQVEAAQTEEEKDKIGCDIEALDIIESAAGEVNPVVLVIEKTGDESGNLFLKSADPEDSEEEVTPIPFTYLTGRMTFGFIEEGATISGKLYAAYAGGKTSVTLKGMMRLTSDKVPGTDFYIDIAIAGTKPLAAS